MQLETRIININEYRLTGTADEFREAIGSIAARVERDGHNGVLGFHFYVNDATDTAGATIVYADAEAWMAHHQMTGGWDEMAKFRQTVEFQRAILFGPMSDEMTAWIDRAGSAYTHHGALAAGFVRPQLANG